MKKTLLTFALSAFIVSSVLSQVTAGQTDDFQDGTTQGWRVGNNSINPPVNITTGGPTGSGDNYLQYTTTGVGGADGRMVVYNQTQWAGDFTAQGIVAIEFDIKVETNDLNIRIAFDGGGGRFCTTNSVSVTAGSGWNHIVIPISAGDFSAVGGSDIADTLADANTVRILSSSSASWTGEMVAAIMEVDNVEAATSLSLNEINSLDFSIYPNPSKSNLNINLVKSSSATKVEVYDILGKRIHTQSLTDIRSRINSSNWNSGVYLVKITNGTGTQTKRFVKE